MRRLKDEDRRLWRDAMRGVKPLQPVAAEKTLATAATGEQRSSGLRTRRLPNPPPHAGEETGGGIDRRTLRGLRRGELAVDARLDLHGMTQAAAHRALARFVAEAAAGGARLALVITGKGRGGEGILRAAVPRWLAEPTLRAHVLATTWAPPNLGGGGALCIRLRRPRERTRP